MMTGAVSQESPLSFARTPSPREQLVARDSSVIFSMLLLLFALFALEYSLFSLSDDSLSGWLFFVASAVCSLGGVLAFSRHFAWLWVFFAVPGVLIPVTMRYDPMVAVQVLAVSAVAIRLCLPRAVAVVFAGLELVAIIVAFLLSQQWQQTYLVADYIINSCLLFVLVDALLVHFRLGIAERRLVLFDATYWFLLAGSLGKLLLDLWIHGGIEAADYRYGLVSLWLIMPMVRKWFPQLFQAAFGVLLVMMVIQSYLSYMFKPSLIGSAWGLVMGSLVIFFGARQRQWLIVCFLFVVLLKMFDEGTAGFYAMMWSTFSVFGVWMLLHYAVAQLEVSPNGRQAPRCVLGLRVPEWHFVLRRFAMYIVALLVMVIALVYPAAQQQQVVVQTRVTHAEKAYLERLGQLYGTIVDSIVTQQVKALSSVDVRQVAFSAVGHEMRRLMPEIKRWLWVAPGNHFVIDIGDRMPRANLLEDERVLQHVGFAQEIPVGHSFVSPFSMGLEDASAASLRSDIYIVTPRHSDAGVYLGAAVSVVDLTTLFSDMLRALAVGKDVGVSFINRQGEFVFRTKDRDALSRSRASADPAVRPSPRLLEAFHDLVGGAMIVESGERVVLKLGLGQYPLRSAVVQSEPSLGFLLIEHDAATDVWQWLLGKPWFWIVQVQLTALLIVAALWRTMADLRKWRLVRALNKQQCMQTLAQKRADEALHAEQMKSRFLSNMSHEMRTPLNGLIGIGQVLQNNYDDTQLPEFIGMMRESAERLNVLINDILDSGAISRGELSLNNQPFDLAALVNGIYRKQSLLAEVKGLEMRCDTGRLTMPLCIGDAQRLGQIVDNLLTNAIKFTDQGFISLKVASTADEVRVVVEDSGIGMNTEVQNRIFERFEQGDLSASRRYQGAGLGLSICRELVMMMGGRLEVVSAPGQGTTFEIVLPLSCRPATIDVPVASESMSLHGCVLIVEDDATNLLVLEEVLKVWGLSTLHANNGEEARALLQHQAVDVVVTDVAMPIMDGATLLQHLRRDYPGLPCVAVTGNAMGDDLQRYDMQGFDGCFVKPIDFEGLKHCLGQLLKKTSAVSPSVSG
ncbi:MAG TPA: ATP-binding protein [Pseudomonadales bacterium]|nr:ATP-binding protein [Pseudomonadales bacterium]